MLCVSGYKGLWSNTLGGQSWCVVFGTTGWVSNLNSLIFIYMCKTEVVFNINTDKIITLLKLWESYYYLQNFCMVFCRPCVLGADQSDLCMVSIFRVTLLNSALILFLLVMLYIFFNTIVRRSDVGPLVSWHSDFGDPGSWLMSGIVSLIPWLICHTPTITCISINILCLLDNTWVKPDVPGNIGL